MMPAMQVVNIENQNIICGSDSYAKNATSDSGLKGGGEGGQITGGRITGRSRSYDAWDEWSEEE